MKGRFIIAAIVLLLVSLTIVQAQDAEKFVFKIAQDGIITLLPPEAKLVEQAISALDNPLDFVSSFLLSTIKQETLKQFLREQDIQDAKAGEAISLITEYASAVPGNEIRIDASSGQIVDGSFKVGETELSLEKVNLAEEGDMLVLKPGEGESKVTINYVNYRLEKGDQIVLDKNGEMQQGTIVTINAEQETELAKVVGVEDYEVKAKGRDIKLNIGEGATTLTAGKDGMSINGQEFSEGTELAFDNKGRIREAKLVFEDDSYHLLLDENDVMEFGKEGLVLKVGEFELEHPKIKVAGKNLEIRFDGKAIESDNGISFFNELDTISPENGKILKAKYKGTLDIEHGAYQINVVNSKVEGVPKRSLDYGYKPNAEEGVFMFSSSKQEEYFYSDSRWGMAGSYYYEEKKMQMDVKFTWDPQLAHKDSERISNLNAKTEEMIISGYGKPEKQGIFTTVFNSEVPSESKIDGLKELKERVSKTIDKSELISKGEFEAAETEMYGYGEYRKSGFSSPTHFQIKRTSDPGKESYKQYAIISLDFSGGIFGLGVEEARNEAADELYDGLLESGIKHGLENPEDFAQSIKDEYLKKGGDIKIQIKVEADEKGRTVSKLEINDFRSIKRLWPEAGPYKSNINLIKALQSLLPGG